MRRKSLRNALIAAAIVLVAAPAAFAFFAEAERERAAVFLEEVRGAQDRARFAGRKIVETPEGTTTLDLRADKPGRVHVESASRPSGRRPSWRGAPRGRFSDPALIAENYRLESRVAEIVAGRKAQRFALVPRHKGRASYEFAVDRENRFLLAFRAVAADGTRLYDSRFESIAFDPAPKADDKEAKPKPSTGRSGQGRQGRFMREPVKEEELGRDLPFTVWRPAWTPPGFKLRSLERHVIRDMGEAVLYRWSDGMLGIQVLQTRASNPAWELFRGAYLGLPETPPAAPPSGEEPVAWRIRHSGGSLLDLSLDDTEVLIGGQVDPDELKQMADHLKKLE